MFTKVVFFKESFYKNASLSVRVNHGNIILKLKVDVFHSRDTVYDSPPSSLPRFANLLSHPPKFKHWFCLS